MTLHVLPVGLLQCNCSILIDETSATAVVVDPGDNIDEIEAILRQAQARVTMILITHAHIDHIGGAAQLKRVTGAPVYMHKGDDDLYRALEVQAAWLQMETPDRTDIDQHLKDGDLLPFGGDSWEVRHTPGHTPGSVSLLLPQENLLLAGDTLFKDSIGRTDLPGGDTKKIMSSIKNKLLTLPDETEVICGHGPQTTIGRERLRNPFLRGL